MDDPSQKSSRDQSRQAHNEEFVRRLYARRPDAKRQYEQVVKEVAAHAQPALEGALRSTGRDAVLETIVRKERPVLFIENDWIDVVNVTTLGEEAKDLITQLDIKRGILQPIMPLVGRIDVVGFPSTDFLGTGWFVDTDVLVTNRHVASLIARHDGRDAFLKIERRTDGSVRDRIDIAKSDVGDNAPVFVVGYRHARRRASYRTNSS